MSQTWDKIILVGNIGHVEWKRSTRTQRPYIRLSVAVDRRGEQEPKWYSCLITGKAAEQPETLLKILQVGRLALLEGKPDFIPYSKSDGSPGCSNIVLLDRLPVLLDSMPFETPTSNHFAASESR